MKQQNSVKTAVAAVAATTINGMTDSEIREAFARLQAQADKRRAYRLRPDVQEKQKARHEAYLARPDVKARMAEKRQERAARLKAILQAAAEMGLKLKY